MEAVICGRDCSTSNRRHQNFNEKLRLLFMTDKLREDMGAAACKSG